MKTPTLQILRTPDERFRDLPDFPYEPHYVEALPGYEQIRAHYLDLGPRNAKQTFLCLHGQPDWSYLYRRMIPVMLESGARVVAPDYPGFGRSDKPAEVESYSFHFFRNFILRFIEHLDLQNITLVVQDWGGILGLTLPADADFQNRLARLFVMNTTLAMGTIANPPFYVWRQLIRTTFNFQVGEYLQHSIQHLTDAEAAGYDAPFPDVRYKAAVRVFPDLVMVEPGMEGIPESEAAARFWSETWRGPTFMAVGAKDKVFGLDVMLKLQKIIHGCPAPFVVEEAGHFLQEWGEPVARAALKAFGDL